MEKSDDFLTLERRSERLYEEGRESFVHGKYERAIELFKQIYCQLVTFRDAEEIVDDYYSKPRDEWVAKYRERFEKSNGMV